MSIATKGGDKGKTSILSGERVYKDDIRVEICGTGDELLSNLGELKFYAEDFSDFIYNVQKVIFIINAYMSSLGDEKNKYLLKKESLLILDDMLKKLEQDYGKINGFIIPSENIASAKADICRTVCRRYERRIITLDKIDKVYENTLMFVNRLSDVLYMIARTIGKDREIKSGVDDGS